MALAAAAVVVGPVALSGTAHAAPAIGAGRHHLGNAPQPPGGSSDEGSAQPGRTLHLTITLVPSDPQGLADYAAEVSTPGSSVYHHYLTPEQFAARFGADPQTVDDARSWLTDQGLTPGPTTPNRLSIPVTASITTVQQAFQISIHDFLEPSGRIAYANTDAPSAPSQFAGSIQGVLGLDDLYQRSTGPGPTGQAALARHAATAVPRASGGASWRSSCGSFTNIYTADQLASAYSMSALSADGLNGEGITVGLFELSTYTRSDVTHFESCYDFNGSHPSPTITTVNVDGGTTDTTGSGEVTLDIEDVIGLAPAANIKVYEGPNSGTGVFDTYSKMIADDTAQVISSSWGLCEPDEGQSAADSENTLFEEAAVQGQTVLAAAGDSGSSDCWNPGSFPAGSKTLAVDDPASQPYVTGVGGTNLTSLTPTETVWNGGCSNACAGGGGISTLWNMPSWQQSAVMGNSSGTPCGAASGSYCRQIPDVSASADPAHGYLIYYGGSWASFGGTSAAAPLWAALVAQVDQCRGARNPVGLLSPTLYQHPGDLHDVTSGNNRISTSVASGDWTAAAGYDLGSGLGTPSAAAILSDACPPVVTSISPSTGPPTGGTAVTISGSGFTLGAAVDFGSTPAASVAVNSATKITVVSPAGTATQDVTVTTIAGSSTTTTADRFTYDGQGTWLGTYGAAGYALGGWNGAGDYVALPHATLSLSSGGRYTWASSTTDVRALESADGSTRRASTWYANGQLKFQLQFSSAYTANLHLYALDWDHKGRVETISVTDHSGTTTQTLSSDFSQGAWLTFPITASAGDTVQITITASSGPNAVLSGLFLG